MKTEDTEQSVATMMRAIGQSARRAAAMLAMTSGDQRNAALDAAAHELRNGVEAIIAANEDDMRAAEARGLSSAMLDRLMLDSDRVAAGAPKRKRCRALGG